MKLIASTLPCPWIFQTSTSKPHSHLSSCPSTKEGAGYDVPTGVEQGEEEEFEHEMEALLRALDEESQILEGFGLGFLLFSQTFWLFIMLVNGCRCFRLVISQ